MITPPKVSTPSGVLYCSSRLFLFCVQPLQDLFRQQRHQILIRRCCGRFFLPPCHPADIDQIQRGNVVGGAAAAYRAAAQQGHADAAVKAGSMLIFGNGVEADSEEGLRLLQLHLLWHRNP